MTDDEIDTWSRWAAPNVVIRVDGYSRITRDQWRRGLLYPGELIALMDWCPGGCFAPELLARAAARAAIELAVICHVHPQPLEPVLRPGCVWRG
jgi:hypothetical protein